MKGRPGGAPVGAVRTFDAIAKAMGVPRSTVYRDFDRARDVLALEIVFAVLPQKIQRQWLAHKLAAVGQPCEGREG